MGFRKNIPGRLPLQDAEKRNTLVENRKVYALRHCELNIFETAEEAYAVPLAFNDLVITSMMRGKKIMHLPQCDSFDYFPGESMILPAHQSMLIDFPEASLDNPVQCVSLAIAQEHIDRTLNYLNESYINPDNAKHWDVNFSRYHFQNDEAITSLINKIIGTSMSADRAKDIYVDLNLQELLVRLIQSENLTVVEADAKRNNNATRLHYAIAFINSNLGQKISIDHLCRKTLLNRNDFFKLFREQFGVSPTAYINIQRIKMAKRKIAEGELNLSNIALQLGFTDANYFSRVFRQTEGVSPSEYAASLHD